MTRLPMILMISALFAALPMAGGPAQAQAAWKLMSREGQCVDLAAAARRLPELRGVTDPLAFARALRAAGHQVEVTEQTAGGMTFIEIKAPGRGLAMVFVPEAACR